jgi:hypothetical protein
MATSPTEISLISMMIFAMLSPVCFGTPPSLPFDSLSAQVTVVSIEGDIATLRIDRIESYTKGPVQAAPRLEIGSGINARVYYVALDNGGLSLSDIIVGRNYSANIQYCVSDESLTCGYEGWSAAMYSSKPTSPPAEEQGYLLIIVFLLILAAIAYISSKKRTAKQTSAPTGKRKAGQRIGSDSTDLVFCQR